VGGQNIPADWFDVDEDRQLSFKTIPARFGFELAGRIILVSIIITLLMNLLFLALLHHGFSFFLAGASLVTGFYLLLLPAYNLYKTKAPALVSKLFNRASFYPLVLLVAVLLEMILVQAFGR
jgi:4-hydroxybenzoate polyprenyltransferase